MLKKEIKYEDFNGDKCVDVEYFNLSKPELIELEVEYDNGFSGLIQQVIESDDKKQIIKIFKQLILMAYGKKTLDGKRFVKNDQIREEFEQTAAYQALFMELSTDAGAAVTFLKGLLPKDMVASIEAEIPGQPPTPPTAIYGA